MNDILLIFVPQWSPFQPPLSLPSLAAWLRRADYSVKCVDANVLLYNWLLSEECANRLLELVESSKLSKIKRDAYKSIIRCHDEFKRDIENLKNSGTASLPSDEKQLYVQKNYLAISSFNSYLNAVSEISDDFLISPYDFRLKDQSQLSSVRLEEFADNPPLILDDYVNWLIDEYVLPNESQVVGLSCIGEEQLPFTLLIGKAIKERFPETPILVGGTIFSRIFERNILKPEWFRKYFDVIVRNEGEKPCEKLLSNLKEGRPLTEDVPGIVYLESDRIRSTQPAPPLKPNEVPTPDFDDIPLASYVCSEITLPLLSSRGCYWGKCEFCHHYMVYGDRYSAYDAEEVVRDIHHLSQKYNVYHFAFNDEAIPPRVITALGRLLPDHEESGYTFTGLIKFEKYYTKEHFANLGRVGFRSLYIGLESASENVLALMKKPNKIATIVNNLRDATESGIWTHCFLFFGFPGETEDDARQTFDFIMSNHEIIGSFGCGTFVLEHNAPIQRHPEAFNLQILNQSFSDVSVYYDYSISQGVTRERATEWMDRLTKESQQVDKYRSTTWIPREFLLSMISHQNPHELVRECIVINDNQGIPPLATVSNIASLGRPGASSRKAFMINRMSRRVALVKNTTLELAELCISNPVKALDLASMNDQMGDLLILASDPVRAPELAAEAF